MMEKIVVALVSGILSACLTMGIKAVHLEGRLDGIEKAIIRIEAKLQ